jgi:hypothetical protein
MMRPYNLLVKQRKGLGFGIRGNLKLNKYIWERSNLPKNLTNQTISSCECRVYCGSHSNQATRHSKLQFILLCKQRYNPRKYRCALDPTTLILGCDSRPYFNFLPNSQHSLDTPKFKLRASDTKYSR